MTEQIGQCAVPSVIPKVVLKIMANGPDVEGTISVVDQKLAGDLMMILLLAGVSFDVRIIEKS